MPTKVGGMEIKMKEIKNILFFIKYIKPQWKTLLTVIVLTIVATGIGLYLPIINSNLVDKGILAKNFDYVLNISIIYTLRLEEAIVCYTILPIINGIC